jgi:phage terminase large subunit
MTIRSVTFTKSSAASSSRRDGKSDKGSDLGPDWEEGDIDFLPDIDTDELMRVSRSHNQDDPSSQGIVLDIETPEAYLPLLPFRRYKGARGGRGGAKSHFFAEQIVENMATRHTRQACLREVQNSIRDSVKQLIEDKIAKLNVAHLFHVTDREIVCPSTDSLCIFRGLRNHTVSSIKSLEGFTDAFIEEAQTISSRSLEVMIPTFRTGSQISFAWNPDQATDPVDELFEQNYFVDGDDDFVCVNVNYWDNPWFPEELRRDMVRDRRRDPEKYDHVWAGGYVQHSEARVFKNWQVESFETPIGAKLMQGADWGYSVDPSVLVRGFIGRWENRRAIPDENGKCLFIDHECYKVGVEIDHTPQLFDLLVKDNRVPVLSQMKVARTVPTIADSSNPQAISYLRRNGYPLMKAAVKGPNSIKEGVQFLQGYDIYVHPRCVHTRDELTHFSYEIDKHTKQVLPKLSEKKNHVIDSLRYMVEPIRRPTGHSLFGRY